MVRGSCKLLCNTPIKIVLTEEWVVDQYQMVRNNATEGRDSPLLRIYTVPRDVDEVSSSSSVDWKRKSEIWHKFVRNETFAALLSNLVLGMKPSYKYQARSQFMTGASNEKNQRNIAAKSVSDLLFL